jgi:hypothetical protein
MIPRMSTGFSLFSDTHPASTPVRNVAGTLLAHADILYSSIKDVTGYKFRNKTTFPHSSLLFFSVLQLIPTWLPLIVEILVTIR